MYVADIENHIRNTLFFMTWKGGIIKLGYQSMQGGVTASTAIGLHKLKFLNIVRRILLLVQLVLMFGSVVQARHGTAKSWITSAPVTINRMCVSIGTTTRLSTSSSRSCPSSRSVSGTNQIRLTLHLRWWNLSTRMTCLIGRYTYIIIITMPS